MSEVLKYKPLGEMIQRSRIGGGCYVALADYDALAQQLAEVRNERDNSEENAGKLEQQLAASQAEVTQVTNEVAFVIDRALNLKNELDEAQATITRLEAMVAKGIDLDYQRRQEIARLNESDVAMDKVAQAIEDDLRAQLAEAVGLLRGDSFPLNSVHWRAAVSAYLAAHEGKENDQ